MLEQRFWKKVNIKGSNECWEWQAATNGRYGQIRSDNRGPLLLAHRVSYELRVGPIQEGFEIDHLCRNTLCVNPEHLEPVTHSENCFRGDNHQLRKTHCPQGHPYDEQNTNCYRGERFCLTCRREQRRWWVKSNDLYGTSGSPRRKLSRTGAESTLTYGCAIYDCYLYYAR